MRPIGQHVRVAEHEDRYHGTTGTIVAHVPAFGTTLYRVRGWRVKEWGEPLDVAAWECLFFPNQLRKFHSGRTR